MQTSQLLLLALAGVAAGWINVMAGGGSMISVPLMIFMGVPAPAANGTNRIAIFLQNIAAVWAFRRRGYFDIKLSLTLAGMATLGALGGAMIGVQLEGVWFNRVLALVMLGVMLLMATENKPSILAPGSTTQPHVVTPRNLLLGHIAMVGAGFWGGFIHVGVGFILLPILQRLLGQDLVQANMHKVTIALVYTVVAFLVFAYQVEIFWQVGLSLALGTVIGGWLGAHSSVQGGEVWIRRVLFLAMSVFIVKLVFL